MTSRKKLSISHKEGKRDKILAPSENTDYSIISVKVVNKEATGHALIADLVNDIRLRDHIDE